MKTKDKLTQDLKEALRAKDTLRKRTIRMVLAAIKNAEIDGKVELDEPGVYAIVQKEVKSRKETIEGAERAGRDDIISEAEAEIAILKGYLPQPLSIREIEQLARDAITETGAATPREMGNVMKQLMPQVQGRADGKTVSQIVRQLLSQ